MAISKFKATCLAVLERVRRTGQPVLVTKRGVPVAQIVPPPSEKRTRSGYGAMRETMRIVGDVGSPLPDEDWDWEATRE